MGRIDEEMDTRFTSERHRLIANVVYTGNWITRRFGDFIKPFGLSSQQFNILRILRGAGDWLSMNEVKYRMVEKSPNATRLCDKLLEKGWIQRERCEEDRRLVHLKISKAGLELLQEIDEADKGKKHSSFLNALSEEEAEQASNLLDKLRG